MSNSEFWSALFEQHQLVPQLSDISRLSEGITFLVSPFGTATVKTNKATTLGDNFLSDTFALDAHLEDGANYKAFVKVLPSNPYLRQAATLGGVYNREIAMYTDLFPLIENERQSNALEQDEIPLDVAKPYYVQKQMNNSETNGATTVVVLEELKSQGFKMADKMKGADYNHAVMALTSLANYHALTLHFLRKYTGGEDGQLRLPERALFLKEKTFFDSMPIEMRRRYFAPHIELMQKLGHQEVTNWMETIDENLESIIKDEKEHDQGPLTCILHGDFWLNNMLYQYADEDSSKILRVRMVDFQISRIGHPLTDILYYLYSSAMPEMRALRMNDLLNHYFDTLASNLDRLGINLAEERYTREHFMQDYRKKSIPSMLMGLWVIAMVVDDSVVGSLEDGKKDLLEDDVNFKPVEKTEENQFGLSKEVEDKFKDLMNADKLLACNNATERILGLVLQVKQLNDNKVL